jgi:hypothetical protein
MKGSLRGQEGPLATAGVGVWHRTIQRVGRPRSRERPVLRRSWLFRDVGVDFLQHSRPFAIALLLSISNARLYFNVNDSIP